MAMIGPCAVITGMLLNIAVPPENFDCDYKGMMSVITMDAAKVHEFCRGNPNAVTRIYACAMPLVGRCLIVLPGTERGGVTKQQQARLRRHEEGHCNKWGADHKGGSTTRNGER